MGGHGHLEALGQREHAVHGEAQAVIEEGLGEADHRHRHARRTALEGHLAAHHDGVRGEADVPGQGLLAAQHQVVGPSAVVLAELRAGDVAVGEAAVDHDAGLVGRVQHHVGVQARALARDDVAVGRVQEVVLVEEAVGGDAVAGVAVAEGGVHHHLRGIGAVHEGDVVAAFDFQLGVAVGEGGRIGGVHVRVQVGDARAGNAHVVADADVLGHGRAPLDAGGRDKAAVVGAESVRLGGGAVVLPGVLVADAALHADGAEVAGEFGVGRADAVVVVIVQAAQGVDDELGAVPEVVLLAGGVVAVDVLGAGGEAVVQAHRGGEVGLDGVVGGAGAAVGLAVGEVEAGDALRVEGVQGVVHGRGAVVLVGQGEGAAGEIGPGVLVVGTHGDAVAGHQGLGRAGVGEGVGAGGEEHRVRGAGGVVGAEVHQAHGGGHEVLGIDLIGGADVAHQHRHGHRGLGVGGGGEAVVLLAGHVHHGALAPLLHAVEVGGQGELALLHAAEQAAAVAAGGSLGAEGAVHAVGRALAAGDGLVGGDVQHAAHALGVIADARVGDDLDVLDGARGHHLEDLRGVLGHHLVGLAVHIDHEGGGTVDGDVVLAVDGDHRHLAEHVQHGGGLGVHVVLDVVGDLVHFHLHERTQRGDGAGLEELGGVLDEDLAQVDHFFAVDLEVAAGLLPAHVVEEQVLVALDVEGMDEGSVLGRGREGDGLGVVVDLEELEDGRRLRLTGQGVEDDAFDGADFLGVRGEAGEQGDEEDEDLFHNIAILLFSISESKSTAICKRLTPVLDEQPVSFDEFPTGGP